uniref:G-protein coupled receptor moody n=1 Tax=Hirondellea gigas TaxID=1518452 RepID=A0A2P2IA43_9CRUS
MNSMAGLIGSLVVSNVSQTQSVGLDTTEPSTLTTYNHSWSDSYNTTSEIANLPRAVTAGIAVVFLSYMLVGVIGNLLTIIALLKCPRVRNVAAAFIISLCIADLLFCVFVLPWEVSRFLFRHWMWGEGLICTLFPLLRYWNIAASLLSIAMITINRYIMIAHYGVYNAIYKPVWIALMIAFCWVFPFTMLLPTLLGQWGRFGLDPRLDTCSIVPVAGERPKEVLFGIGFCVPALVIVVCYSGDRRGACRFTAGSLLLCLAWERVSGIAVANVTSGGSPRWC